MDKIIEMKNICKTYNKGKENELKVLKNINLVVKKSDFLAIMGPSGSGKTTLMDIMGCLLKPDDSGELIIEGVNISTLNENALAKIRREKIGFVFQQFNLIPTLTALENVSLPIRIAGKSKEYSIKRAAELLALVGLEKRMEHKPSQLSGGEQQRVAIARSLANKPKIILGDEPTGNLDTKAGKRIMELLKYLNRKEKYTIIVVTHDPRIEDYTDKIIRLKDGEII